MTSNQYYYTFKEAKQCLLYHTALNEIISDLNDNRLDDLSNETLESLKHIDATSENTSTFPENLVAMR